MDPNATLAAIRIAIANHHDDDVAELFDALDGWISRGGFLPSDWDFHPTA
jgi:hypothetical protein